MNELSRFLAVSLAELVKGQAKNIVKIDNLDREVSHLRKLVKDQSEHISKLQRQVDILTRDSSHGTETVPSRHRQLSSVGSISQAQSSDGWYSFPNTLTANHDRLSMSVLRGRSNDTSVPYSHTTYGTYGQNNHRDQ